MNRPVYFQLPSAAPEKLAEFYRNCFGWGIAKVDALGDVWLLQTGPLDQPGLQGMVMGRFMRGPVNVIGVEKLDAVRAKLTAHGGKITTPRFKVPGSGDFAWCEDSDGNAFVLMESELSPAEFFGLHVNAGQLPPNPSRPVHFEIPASDTGKVAAFYTGVFGWTAQRWEGGTDYVFLLTGSDPAAGIDGAVMPREDATDTVNVLEVDDLEASLERLKQFGGTVVTEPGPVSGVGIFSYVNDPDGNRFGLIQLNPPGQESGDTSELATRIAVLEQELIHKKGELYRMKKQLPRWEVQDYLLRDRQGREIKLSQLFGDRRELILVHNMGAHCPYCTLCGDDFNGILPHLTSRAAFAVATPDPWDKMDRFAASRGWKFALVSTAGTSLKKDLGFEEGVGGFLPGVTTLFKEDNGRIMHVANAVFGPGDDFSPLWYFFELLAVEDRDWVPKYSY